MSSRPRFILLTPNDVPTRHPPIENDCACPTDGLAWEEHKPRPLNLHLHYQRPALYTARLSSEYGLAFNPLGSQGSLGVLNVATQKLLARFARPARLPEVAHEIATDDPAAALAATRRLVAAGLLIPEEHQDAPPPNEPATLTAWLHVTNACNLRCPYCYVAKSAHHMPRATGYKAVDAVFRSARQHNFKQVKLKYAGGEAALNFPLILELQDYARQLADEQGTALDGVVLSNGIGWTGRMIAALQTHRLRLMLSLDGVRDAHDRQRPFVNGKGSFHQVERTLDRLAAAGVTPTISVTISGQNVAELPQLVAYLLERQLPFTLNFYRENTCSANYVDLKHTEEALLSGMRAAFALIAANPPRYSLLGTLLDRARLDQAHGRPCGVGQSYMVVQHTGALSRCHMELDHVAGRMDEADPLLTLRLSTAGVQNPHVDEKEGCRDCHWRYWCAGGCPALTYRLTGRYDVRSPNCNIYQALFPEVLRLEGRRLLHYGLSGAH